MSLGNKLKELRKKSGKSSLEVSSDLGISRSTLQMYEADLRRPKDDIKRKLADYYNVGIEDLFFLINFATK